ncbi:MAG: hypothetical protein WCF95_04155 [bacterium]
MISKIAVLEPRSFSGRSNQKENRVIAPKLEYLAMAALDTPNAFYNKQILSASGNLSGVNFSGFHLREVPNLHCPCCGKMMYTQEQIKKFAEKLSVAKGENISKFLGPHLHNLHPVEKNVAETLINLSEANPEKTIKELLMLKRLESKVHLEKEQIKLINSAIKDAKNLEGGVKGDLLNRLHEIKRIVLKGKHGHPFKRKNVVATIENFALSEKNPSNQEILKNMSDKIHTLPMSGNDFNAFILKYTQVSRDDFEIAKRIFFPNQPTIEHINPALRSVKNINHGKNDLSNYLDMCLDCNGERGIEPYYLFVERKPQMKENLPRHMNEVQHYIRKKDMPSYYDYPLKVRQTIREQSTSPDEQNPKLDFDTTLIENYIERKTGLLRELYQQYMNDKK